MSYKNEYYEKALAIIRDNKNRRDKEYAAKIAELYAAVPELKNIESELSSLGARAMKAAMTGECSEIKEIQQASTILETKKAEILKSAKIKAPCPACKECGDTGYNGTQLCRCVKALAKELVFSDLSAKTPIANQSFKTFDLSYYEGTAHKTMSSIYSFAKEYAESFNRNSDNLLFLGGVGLGKTHISLSIINTVIEKGYGVIYDSAQNLFNQIEKEHFSYSGSSEKIDAILTCDLLVIDDLGTEFSTSFTVSQFYNIVNTRINNGLPTIINSNLGLADIEKSYTARVLSRIMGNYIIKKFEGSDIRIKKALEK